MTILCIETSTSVCSAAICKDGMPVDQCINYEGSNHARLLPRYLEDLLEKAQKSGLSIEAIALSEGPGSYTGLRIGTSMAKGLCYGMHIPLIPVPTLQILCESAIQNPQWEATDNQVALCPMIDARRMEVYTAFYNSDCKTISAIRSVIVDEQWAESHSEENKLHVFFGDGAAKCRPILSLPHWHYLPGIVAEAKYMGILAEEKMQQGFQGADVAYYEPYYLKEFVAKQSHVKGLV